MPIFLEMTQFMNGWTVERGELWGIEFKDPPPQAEPRIAARIARVNIEQIAELAAAMQVLDEKEIRQRFAPGRRCYATFVEGRIAGYGWVSRCPEYIGEQEREIQLQADEAYIWDCATLPQYRKQHLYSALLSYINGVLANENVTRAYIGSSVSNQGSVRGFRNAGFHPVIRVTYIRFLKLCVTWISAQPGASADFVATAREMWISKEEHVWGPLAWRWAHS